MLALHYEGLESQYGGCRADAHPVSLAYNPRPAMGTLVVHVGCEVIAGDHLGFSISLHQRDGPTHAVLRVAQMDMGPRHAQTGALCSVRMREADLAAMLDGLPTPRPSPPNVRAICMVTSRLRTTRH